MDLGHTWPRCRSGHQNRECRRWSGRYECPPRRVLVSLVNWHSSHALQLNKDAGHAPTVMGLILTPSSIWAELGSSLSLCVRTLLSQRVLTKVVLPAEPKALDKHGRARIYRSSGGKVVGAGWGIRHTCARSTAHHKAELDALLDVLLSSDHFLRRGRIRRLADTRKSMERRGCVG